MGNTNDLLATFRFRGAFGAMAGLQNWKNCASNSGGISFHDPRRRPNLVHFSTLR